MARATDITELGLPHHFAPWWDDVQVKDHDIIVAVDDPDEGEGSGITLTKTLKPAAIHASFAQLKDTHLCCAETMAEDGYDCGCAGDADLILQHATFGEIIYG